MNTSNLYQEAIADAAKLKEIAEQNAKNKILEAVTPRIKLLIEQELSQDVEEEVEQAVDAVADSEEVDYSDDFDQNMASLELDASGESFEAPVSPTSDVDSHIDSVPDVDVHTDESPDGKKVTVNITVEEDESDDGVDEIYEVSKRAMARFGAKQYKLIKNRAGFLVAKLQETRSTQKRIKILTELASLRKRLIVNNNKQSRNLALQISGLLKESSNMSRRTRRRSRLNENAWWLFEGEESEESDDLELDVEEEADEGDDAEVDVDAASMALEDLGAALGLDVSVATEDEEIEDDADAEDDAEEDMDLDLEEYGGTGYFTEGDEEDADEDEKVEISESMLRRELSRLRSSRNPRRRRASRRVQESRRRRFVRNSRRRLAEEAEAKDKADNFGGGKLDKEHFVEVDENTLLNALAEELGGEIGVSGGDAVKAADNFGGGSVERSPAAMQERRRRNSRRNHIAKNRLAKRAQLAEQKAVAARKELKESNLFNAKLLYVNKLMQQHQLNTKQQRAIVEALDNAKTLREAKLLFTSLTDSLSRRKASKGTIREGVIRSGSASTSTRSAAPSKSGVELDRWAKLAGIKS